MKKRKDTQRKNSINASIDYNLTIHSYTLLRCNTMHPRELITIANSYIKLLRMS